MTSATTIAQQVAVTMGHDGRRYFAPSGEDIIALCQARGATMTSQPYNRTVGRRLRYEFADGSAIWVGSSTWAPEELGHRGHLERGYPAL